MECTKPFKQKSCNSKTLNPLHIRTTNLNLFQVNLNDITTLGNAPVYDRSLYQLNLFQVNLVGSLPVRGAADGDPVDGDQVVLHGRNRLHLHYNHLSRTRKCNC